jgi:hypothetical protein
MSRPPDLGRGYPQQRWVRGWQRWIPPVLIVVGLAVLCGLCLWIKLA